MRSFDMIVEQLCRFEDILTLQALGNLQRVLHRAVLQVARHRVEGALAFLAPDGRLDERMFGEQCVVAALLRFLRDWFSERMRLFARLLKRRMRTADVCVVVLSVVELGVAQVAVGVGHRRRETFRLELLVGGVAVGLQRMFALDVHAKAVLAETDARTVWTVLGLALVTVRLHVRRRSAPVEV